MMYRTLCSAALASVLLCAVASVNAAGTVGNEGFTVPPLACFGPAPVKSYDMTSVASDLSGATYDPESGNVFVVNNGAAIVYEITLPDTLVGRWDLSSIITDPESISAMVG
jgi:hypothetical protein